MSLNFPSSPTVGQVFIAEGVSFTWTGAVWVQTGGVSATEGIPVGAVMFFAANRVPAGWLVCANQPVTEIYPDLRDYLLDAGSPYGELGGDPRAPDLRGEFIRGFDDGRGVDAGRVFGSAQADEFKSHTHPIQGQVVDGSIAGGTTTPSVVAGNRFNATIAAAVGGTETRPRNVALLPCIKAFAATVVEGVANFALATPEQARAGTSPDTLMTPALVQARQGRQQIVVTGQGFAPFNQIPNEATEIDVILNGVNFAANAGLFFDFEGGANARAFSTRSAFQGATVVNTVGDDNLTVFNLDFNNAITGVAGCLRLVRDGPGGAWGVSGTLRRASNFLLSYAGIFGMNGDVTARFRLGSQAAMIGGLATAVWRV
jgi:microcystin-dependent protein